MGPQEFIPVNTKAERLRTQIADCTRQINFWLPKYLQVTLPRVAPSLRPKNENAKSTGFTMSSSNTQTTIAIVSYNSHDAVISCLGDLIASETYPVIIVDNGSPDLSGQRLKKQYPHIELIEAPQNLGYGRGANLALKHAKTDYLFLVNPDLKLTADAVEGLVEHVQSEEPVTTISAPAVRIKDHLNQGVQERKWVIGAALLFNIPNLKDIGFFDENIFLFSEESDLCYRTKAAGHRIVLDTDIYVEHLRGQSSTPDPKIERLKSWHFGWSHVYFYQKHGLATGKRNPYRIAFQYLYKWLFSTNSHKRLKYRARFEGTKAFIQGKTAFLKDGSPRWP